MFFVYQTSEFKMAKQKKERSKLQLFVFFWLGQNNYPVYGHRYGRLQNRCGDAHFYFFLPTEKYVIHVYMGTTFPTHRYGG